MVEFLFVSRFDLGSHCSLKSLYLDFRLVGSFLDEANASKFQGGCFVRLELFEDFINFGQHLN